MAREPTVQGQTEPAISLDKCPLRRRFHGVKAILTSLVLASAVAVAQQTAPEPTLKKGSAVNLEAVSAAKWIQGEPLTAFEPGKVYMFECWATWCGPCIAAIPHVNDLHKKYFDKGLRIYGMNVWEDGEDKVKKFVKGKGEGMSYPVAYTGKGSVFETDWLKAAGVRGIPHAFIVKDGKLLLTSHPAKLTDSVIEALLSGDEGAKKAIEEISAASGKREKARQVMQDFRKAASSKDVETMAAKLAEFEKLDPSSAFVPTMKLDLQIAKKDWQAATQTIEELPEGMGKQMTVSMTASKIGLSQDGDYAVDFIKAVAKTYVTMLEHPKMASSPVSFVMLTDLQWKSGDKESAKASAKKAVEVAEKSTSGKQLPVAAFEKYAKSVEDGSLPTMQEFSGWLREGMPKKDAPAAETKPAPAE